MFCEMLHLRQNSFILSRISSCPNVKCGLCLRNLEHGVCHRDVEYWVFVTDLEHGGISEIYIARVMYVLEMWSTGNV